MCTLRAMRTANAKTGLPTGVFEGSARAATTEIGVTKIAPTTVTKAGAAVETMASVMETGAVAMDVAGTIDPRR